MLSASGHSTACTSTNSRLPVPSPNHSSAIGSNAIDGSGLNIDVSIASRSRPMRVDTASDVSANAKNTPSA